MVLGLVASVVLAQGSLLHAIGMVIARPAAGTGRHRMSPPGGQRFTFGIPQLADGIGFVVVAMGMFGLARSSATWSREDDRSGLVTKKITSLMPTREDWKRMVGPILRGTAIGSALGILPGSGSILGSFAAYSLEKKISKNSAAVRQGGHRRSGRPRIGQ